MQLIASLLPSRSARESTPAEMTGFRSVFPTFTLSAATDMLVLIGAGPLPPSSACRHRMRALRRRPASALDSAGNGGKTAAPAFVGPLTPHDPVLKIRAFVPAFAREGVEPWFSEPTVFLVDDDPMIVAALKELVGLLGLNCSTLPLGRRVSGSLSPHRSRDAWCWTFACRA